MAERKTREAWVGLHDPTQTKKMNKEGGFLEKCGFSSGLAWCTVLKAVDLKMLRQEFVIVAIKRQMNLPESQVGDISPENEWKARSIAKLPDVK